MVTNWTTAELEEKLEKQPIIALYLYTPMCGTCQVAGRMLDVTSELLPSFPIGKMDLNFAPELAEEYGVESVPCLLTMIDGELHQKIYAFKSVPYLYEELKLISE
ncbi:thioredoxin family protein [Bacillus sp. 2205SS5-2]|uniref:thioredoxin family protein n=1 Tax=Bacillus sp. 2205SS5-2 TaxID=3109031 RepID=UPI0030063F6A